jgi:hypothetical protein
MKFTSFLSSLGIQLNDIKTQGHQSIKVPYDLAEEVFTYLPYTFLVSNITLLNNHFYQWLKKPETWYSRICYCNSDKLSPQYIDMIANNQRNSNFIRTVIQPPAIRLKEFSDLRVCASFVESLDFHIHTVQKSRVYGKFKTLYDFQDLPTDIINDVTSKSLQFPKLKYIAGETNIAEANILQMFSNNDLRGFSIAFKFFDKTVRYDVQFTNLEELTWKSNSENMRELVENNCRTLRRLHLLQETQFFKHIITDNVDSSLLLLPFDNLTELNVNAFVTDGPVLSSLNRLKKLSITSHITAFAANNLLFMDLPELQFLSLVLKLGQNVSNMLVKPLLKLRELEITSYRHNTFPLLNYVSPDLKKLTLSKTLHINLLIEVLQKFTKLKELKLIMHATEDAPPEFYTWVNNHSYLQHIHAECLLIDRNQISNINVIINL